jgi:hypothetical protein
MTAFLRISVNENDEGDVVFARRWLGTGKSTQQQHGDVFTMAQQHGLVCFPVLMMLHFRILRGVYGVESHELRLVSDDDVPDNRRYSFVVVGNRRILIFWGPKFHPTMNTTFYAENARVGHGDLRSSRTANKKRTWR